MIELASRSSERTAAIGRALGSLLEPGDIVGISGPLGAGKTVLVRGAVAGAGIAARYVNSPTFTIYNVYRRTGLTLVHADFYRLSDPGELYHAGFEEWLDGRAVVMIEWIDRVPGAAAWCSLRIGMDGVTDEPGERRVRIETGGWPAAERLAGLLGEGPA